MTLAYQPTYTEGDSPQADHDICMMGRTRTNPRSFSFSAMSARDSVNRAGSTGHGRKLGGTREAGSVSGNGCDSASRDRCWNRANCSLAHTRAGKKVIREGVTTVGERGLLCVIMLRTSN